MAKALAAEIRAAHAALFTDGDLDAVERYFAPGYVAHLTDGELRGGPEAIRGFLESLRRAFTELRFELEILVEGRDRVAWQRTLRATHARDFKGFPASGRPIVWRDMVTSRFEGGRIVEDWSISDLAEQLLRARKR